MVHNSWSPSPHPTQSPPPPTAAPRPPSGFLFRQKSNTMLLSCICKFTLGLALFTCQKISLLLPTPTPSHPKVRLKKKYKDILSVYLPWPLNVTNLALIWRHHWFNYPQWRDPLGRQNSNCFTNSCLFLPNFKISPISSHFSWSFTVFYKFYLQFCFIFLPFAEYCLILSV